jgi:hypothetical protein
MNDDILFDSGTYQIISKIEGDPIDWEFPSIKSICKGLLTEGAPRNYFFKRDLRKLYNNGLPHFFLDPIKFFDATTKSDSNFFHLIECYQNDTDGSLKDFLKYLIKEKAVDSDTIKLLKCKCGKLTLSAGNWCGHCDCKKNQSDRRYDLYYLPEEIKMLFNRPGAIIEGVSYHALKELESKGVKVYPNVQLKYGEGKEKQELDLVIIDEKRTKIMVILSSISPQDRAEKKQCDVLINNKIKSIFITTENDKATEGIKMKNELSPDTKIDIICDIMEDSDFPNNLLVKVSEYFNI